MNETNQTLVMVTTQKKETTLEMLKSFTNILFDTAGIMGVGGTLLLTVTALVDGLPAFVSAAAGAVLVLVSSWQKVQVTRRQNAAERRRQELYLKKREIIMKVEANQLAQEMADWLIKHLDTE